MAIPKKGVRRITVNGSLYRWIVAPNDEPGLGIVVELLESPGQKMIAWVEHGNIISPSIVKKVILHALSIGWQPEKLGRTIEFRFDNLLIRDTESFVHKLLIRNYQNSDDKAVRRLYSVSPKEDLAYSPESKLSKDLYDTAKFCFEPESLFIVGSINNQIIAVGGYKKLSSGKVEIRQMLVHSNFRRCGSGQQILKYLEMQAGKMGVTTFNLHTTSTQVAAQKLYVKNGFAEIKRQPWRSMERIYFEKRLCDRNY